MATATDDIEFRAADLIGPAGSGENGAKLVATLDTYYDPVLKGALLKRVNERLQPEVEGDNAEGAFKSAASIADVDEVISLTVRGGELYDRDAMVIYAWLDSRGVVWKGCFPYSDLGKKSSDGHVSQAGSLAASREAADHKVSVALASGQPSPDAQVEQRPVDPIADYDEMSAEDVVKYLVDYPARGPVVKALEEATRGDKARKTIMEWEPPAPEGDGKDPGQGGGSGS